MTDLARPTAQGQRPAVRPPGRPAVTTVRIVAAAITALLVGGGALSAASWFFVRRETSVHNFAGGVTEVNVRTDTGDVEVRAAGPGEGTRVVARIEKTFGDPEWSATLTGGSLDVTASCDVSVAVGFNACEVDFEVVVPASAVVVVSSDVGDVDVRGIQNGLTAETDTGDVRAVDLGGDLRVESDVGDVDGIRLTSGGTDVDTNTGDVRLRFEAPPSRVDATTDTGDIDVLVPADGTSYRVTAPQNGPGDVSVDVPTSSAATRAITVELDTGDALITTRG